MALYLYLQFPALQLDNTSIAATSALPLAVVDEQHRIVQLDSLCAERGIKFGMTLGSAAALCHNLQLIPYQHARQLELLDAVAQQLYQLSPDIALDPPEGLYLRLCQILSLYQGLDGCWQAVQSALAALPYRYFYATGNTPLAAKCLARQQLNLISSDGEALLAQLQRSPLRFTDLSTEIQQQLQRLGLQQLGQVMALSQAELGRRFEHSLLSYLGRLRGEFYHALDYIQPQQGFSSTLELLYDISDTAVLNTPLKLLLQQLERQLQRADALCHQLLLEIRFRAQKPLTIVISSVQGEYRAAQWLRLCQLKLETVRLTEPASGIKLDVPRFAPQRPDNNTLFQPVQGGLSALQLTSVLQARLGRAAVSGLSLQNQHLPEQASGRPLPFSSTNNEVAALAVRPAFLFQSAIALTEQVELNSGPERFCINRWQPQLQRDYFIGRNRKGQWLWLYRTAEQRWFVQGIFS